MSLERNKYHTYTFSMKNLQYTIEKISISKNICISSFRQQEVIDLHWQIVDIRNVVCALTCIINLSVPVHWIICICRSRFLQRCAVLCWNWNLMVQEITISILSWLKAKKFLSFYDNIFSFPYYGVPHPSTCSVYFRNLFSKKLQICCFQYENVKNVRM